MQIRRIWWYTLRKSLSGSWIIYVFPIFADLWAFFGPFSIKLRILTSLNLHETEDVIQRYLLGIKVWRQNHSFYEKRRRKCIVFYKKAPYVSRCRTVASEKVYRRILNTDSRLPVTILLQSIPNTCLFVDLPRRSIGTNRQTDTKTPYSINI